MAEYSIDAKTLVRLCAGAFPDQEEDRFYYWLDAVDSVGPMLPFLVKRECLEKIPYDKLGISKVDLSQCNPLPDEVWVLFCFKQTFRMHAGAESAMRTDGFALILEWRKDTRDSSLLSDAFHALADIVRKQLKVTGWGLHPAYSRYGDKVEFTDGALFADGENVDNVASAYGAIAVGLYCSAIEQKYPRHWPFPTLQWDTARGMVAGVAGLREKLQVARDCGATSITVAGEQTSAVRRIAKELAGDEQTPLGAFGIGAKKNFRRLFDEIAFGAERRSRLWKKFVLVAALPVLVVSLVFAVGCWCMTRDVIKCFADNELRFGIDVGSRPVDASTLRKNGGYVFTYCGYRKTNEGWLPRLKRVTRVNRRGKPTPYPCQSKREESVKFHADRSIASREYGYAANGALLEVRETDVRGRLRGVFKFYEGETGQVEHVMYDSMGNPQGATNGRRFIKYDAAGRMAKIVETSGEGWSFTYSYDEAGNMVRQESRNPIGELAPDGTGVTIYEIEYNEKGFERGRFFYDANNRRVLSRNTQVSGFTNAYDDANNLIRTVCIGLDGEPAAKEDGVAVVDMEYDAEHRVVRCMTRDKYFEPVVASGCEHSTAVGWMAEYDTQGVKRIERYFDAKERPAIQRGMAYVKFEDSGRIKSKRFYGTNDCLVLSSEGCAGLDVVEDESGNAVRTTTIGLDNRPCTNIFGYATVVRRVDDYGRETYLAWLDEQDRPVPLRFNGSECFGKFKSAKFNYGGRALRVMVEFAAMDENADAVKFLLRMRPNGDVELGQYFDRHGKLIAGPNGWAQVALDYDMHGFAISKRFLDPNGALYPEKGTEIAQMTSQYNRQADGVDVRVHFLGVDGYHRADASFGIASMFLTYDTRANLTAISMRDKNNQPIRLTGIDAATIRLEHGVDGRLKTFSGTKEDGEAYVICKLEDGSDVCKVEFLYDVVGNIVVVRAISRTGAVLKEQPADEKSLLAVKLILKAINTACHVFRFRRNYFGIGPQDVQELQRANELVNPVSK